MSFLIGNPEIISALKSFAARSISVCSCQSRKLLSLLLRDLLTA
ncbi:MAG: hypothetical protein ACLTER_17065 [Ruminococcus sp.]